MISFLYDFIYSYPIYLLSLILLEGVLNIPERNAIFYVLSIIMFGLVASLKNLARSLNLLFAGLLSAIAVGIVLVQKPDYRITYVHEHLWIGWMLLVAVVMFVIGRLIISSRLVRYLSAIALIISAAFMMNKAMEIDRIVVVVIFFELLVYLVEEIQRNWIKSGDTDKKKHLMFIAPMLIIMCIVLQVIPMKETPYDWKFVRLAGHRVVELTKMATRYLPGRSDEYVEVGFSETTSMAGILQQNPRELIELTAGKNSGKVIYLAGKTLDSFDGREWTNTYVVDNHDRLIDMLETWCSAFAYDPDYLDDYIKYANLSLRYQVFNTKYLFMPAKVNISLGKFDDIEYLDRSDAVIANDSLGYGTTYSFHYYELNKDSELFSDFVNDNKGFSEDIWNYKCGKDIDYSYADYLKHKQDIYTNYTENIEISDELQILLDTLYDGAESEWEKLKRLEMWLTSYNYTNAPGDLPEYVNDPSSFLDYFMLKKQEGYCVHFATSFVLLARAEGLPARIVQGYAVNRKGQKEVMVTSDMAHAWPEVYFDNVGWISFDPTPGYHKNVSWKVSDRNASDQSDSKYVGMDYETLRDMYMSRYEDEESEDDKEADLSTDIGRSINVSMIIIPVLLGVVFAILFMGLYRLWVSKKYKSLSSFDKAKMICKINIETLKMLGFAFESGETLEEYKDRLSKDLPEEILVFVDYYEKLIYANLEPDNETFEALEKTNDDIIKLLADKKRYITFWYKIRLCIRFATLL